MQSLSKHNKGIKYLLRAIDLFSKYAWVIPLKDRRAITIVNAFQKNALKKNAFHLGYFSNEKYPKWKVGDHVMISKFRNILAKGYTQNWSEKVFIVSKIKDAVPWTYVISDLNGEKITGRFYEKELQKTSQEKLRIEKVLKRKGDKSYVKRKGYDNSFNSCINEKDLV